MVIYLVVPTIFIIYIIIMIIIIDTDKTFLLSSVNYFFCDSESISLLNHTALNLIIISTY